MTTLLRRQQRVETFRERLNEVIERSGQSRSAFAARIGVDRSTLTQLLSPENLRLPRAETLASIAGEAQVSVDWLLALSQEGQLNTDVFNEALEIEAGAGNPHDARLQRWHAESVGYKIRYVPTTLPDLLKTEEVIRYEYPEEGNFPPSARVEQAEARLAYSRRPETDMEICSSLESVEAFARGEGIWRHLDRAVRGAALESMARLLDELYPTVRWFLYDGRRSFSPPFSIFGPKRAALYLGNMYFVFNSTLHIRVLTGHFDHLIRAAVLQPPDVIARLEHWHHQHAA